MSNAVIWQALREQPLHVASWLELARGYAQRDLPWHLSYVKAQAERLPVDSPQAAEWREQIARLSCARTWRRTRATG